MKHILLLMALLVSAISFSQIVNIPDPLFKQRLVEYTNPIIDTNGDGEIQVSEAEIVIVLSFGGGGNSQISDFTGIEEFINLEQFAIQSALATTIDLNNNNNLEELFITISNLESISLPNNTDSLRAVELWNNNFTNLDVLYNYPNLEEISIFNNPLEMFDTSNFLELEIFSIAFTQISEVNFSNNPNLKSLGVNSTPITELDLSSINLESLGVGNDNGPTLSALDLSNQTSLESLLVAFLDMNTIDVTSNANLLTLNLSGVPFSTIDLTNNLALQQLRVSSASISSLDLSQNLSLEELTIGGGLSGLPLNSLDITQNVMLKDLEIINTPIAILDVTNLLVLERCRLVFTEITVLDLTNSSQLLNLDLWGPSFNDIIYPSQNNLLDIEILYTQLDVLNFSNFENLCRVFIRYNPNLSSLNIQNGNNAALVSGNSCFDLGSALSVRYNPNLNFVCVDDAAFAATNLPFVSPYITFTEDCSLTSNDLNQIQGVVSYDEANNGCASGNLPLDGFIVSSSDGINTFANASNNGGNYNINLSENTYTTGMVGLPTYFEATPITVSDTFVGFGQVEEQDFCVQATVTANDLNVSINPQYAPIPGGTGLYSIVYQNAGTTELAATVTLIFEDAKMSFDSAIPAPTSQTSNSLTWDVGTLPVFTTAALDVRFNLEGALVIGTPLEFTATVAPVAGDETPEDNEFTMVDFVAAERFAEGMDVPQGSEELIENAGNYLNYVVNFENNTGNTVEDIIVSTLLSDNLDLSTLQVINSSHPVTVRLFNNEVYFNLDDINLPDRAAEQSGGGDTGYVMYRARPRSGMSVGDVVSSSAIVFLDGFPVFTNNVNTVFVDVLDTPSFSSLEIGLYPNPTKGIFHITSNETIESVTVYNISGQQLKSLEGIQQTETTLTIETLAAGMYFANVKTAKGTKVFRVLKE